MTSSPATTAAALGRRGGHRARGHRRRQTNSGPALAERVDLTLTVSESQDSTTIERVWLDTTRPKSGATHTLNVMLRDYRGATETLTMPVTMPTHASGPLTLVVSDATDAAGARRSRAEARQAHELARPARIDERRTPEQPCLRSPREQQPGTVVAGDALPSLPASVRSILDEDKTVATAPVATICRRLVGAAPESRGPRLARADVTLTPRSPPHRDRIRQPHAPASSLFLAALRGSPAALTGSASGPMFWTVASPAEFLKGTSDGVFVSLEGVLSPGPAFSNRLTSTPAQIWSVAEGPDGTLWAGTGGDGKLLRLRAGPAGRNGASTRTSPTSSRSRSSGNRVYAASSPDGRVYVIEGNAAARPFFDPEEKYIWALAVDGAGRLWVGAGNPAVIYRVEANGTGQGDLQAAGGPRRVAGSRCAGPDACRHGIARAGCIGSERTIGPSHCSTPA